jgi:hypothetical protein
LHTGDAIYTEFDGIDVASPLPEMGYTGMQELCGDYEDVDGRTYSTKIPYLIPVEEWTRAEP